jgi:hypothetical protein
VQVSWPRCCRDETVDCAGESGVERMQRDVQGAAMRPRLLGQCSEGLERDAAAEREKESVGWTLTVQIPPPFLVPGLHPLNSLVSRPEDPAVAPWPLSV